MLQGWCKSEAFGIKPGAQNFLQVWAKISLKFERTWLTPSPRNPARPSLASHQAERENALANAAGRKANNAILFLSNEKPEQPSKDFFIQSTTENLLILQEPGLCQRRQENIPHTSHKKWWQVSISEPPKLPVTLCRSAHLHVDWHQLQKQSESPLPQPHRTPCPLPCPASSVPALPTAPRLSGQAPSSPPSLS